MTPEDGNESGRQENKPERWLETDLQQLRQHLETLRASLLLDPQLTADLNVLALKRGSRR